MFEQSPRRHPVQTFQFWFIVLCSFGVVSAWKLDLFTSSDEESEPTPPVATLEALPPPPRAIIHRTATAPTEPHAAPEPGQLPAQITATELPPAQVETQLQPEGLAIDASDRDSFLNESHNESRANRPDSGRRSGGDSSIVQAHHLSSDAMDSMADSGIVRTAYVRKISRNPEVSGVSRSEQTTLKPETTPAAPPIDLNEVDQLLEAERDVEALRLLSKWYWSNSSERYKFEHRLISLASRIYFQPNPHYLQPHVVQFGENLDTIAKRYQVTPQYLARVNKVDPIQVRAGHTLKVLQGPFSAVIDLSDLELTVHSNGYFLTRMPVGLGDNLQLPPGRYEIAEKLSAPDIDRDLVGTRWLSLSNETGSSSRQGIHGTSDPALVGSTGEPGCVRLHNREVEGLYDLLRVGAEVIVKP